MFAACCYETLFKSSNDKPKLISAWEFCFMYLCEPMFMLTKIRYTSLGHFKIPFFALRFHTVKKQAELLKWDFIIRWRIFSLRCITIITYLSFSKYDFIHMHNGHLWATISILFDKRLVGSDAWNDLKGRWIVRRRGNRSNHGFLIFFLFSPLHRHQWWFQWCYFTD